MSICFYLAENSSSLCRSLYILLALVTLGTLNVAYLLTFWPQFLLVCHTLCTGSVPKLVTALATTFSFDTFQPKRFSSFFNRNTFRRFPIFFSLQLRWSSFQSIVSIVYVCLVKFRFCTTISVLICLILSANTYQMATQNVMLKVKDIQVINFIHNKLILQLKNYNDDNSFYVIVVLCKLSELWAYDIIIMHTRTTK